LTAAVSTKGTLTAMRDLIAVIAGAALSFALTLGGSVLAWLILVGNLAPGTNKDGLERWMVVQAFVIIPGAAVIVAVFVSWLAQRSRWWLGTISLLPLFAFGYIRGEARAEVLLSLVYLLLATAAAFILSRFKQVRQLA
jgi:hypothetical protein